MKVLVISHMYPSNFNTMAGIFVKKQVEELTKLGCEVKVISPVPWSGFPLNIISSKWKKYSNIPYEDVIDGVKVYYPRYLEFPKGYAFEGSGKRMYNAIKKLVLQLNEKDKFDLIHCHVALPDGYCGMLLKEELKIPLVTTVHGQDFQYTINKSEKLKKAVFHALRASDKIITVSNKLRNIVKDQDFNSKIEVISNGISLEDCILNEKTNLDNVPFDIGILSASNLVKTKGIDLNIKAMKEVVKKHKKLKYYIIGSGPEKDNLMELTKKCGLQDNVVFKGRLEHKEVIKYMSKCQIFSLPSWQEGFGVAYVEAMLQGKPVIGVKGEGIEDVISHMKNGILVESKNLEDLIKNIEFLLENKEKANNIAKEGKKTVVNDFTWKNTAKKTIKLYNTMIN
ncbi:glycosyltransferase [Haloimpatiens sp. FM7315]|uniref:glycosyltransferase n=1 Tax=Haloimpatiens sp. FM7315 TaxID=3298609 RepID=UPI0035A33A87